MSIDRYLVCTCVCTLHAMQVRIIESWYRSGCAEASLSIFRVKENHPNFLSKECSKVHVQITMAGNFWTLAFPRDGEVNGSFSRVLCEMEATTYAAE